ncbi:hypothetical protein [Primorskyibacter sp. S87]|uniref:hypothetical protein n=1 Tax=Primorskyibacter sp. S87 TaxID=3415126 RepID=UPI003C7C347D
MRFVLFCLSFALTASPSYAQEALGLSAPEAVVQSGLLKHVLPRFSLKTGVRVVPDPAGAMELSETPPGDPVFAADGVIYHLRIGTGPGEARFRDWLLSEIGKRTIESFQPQGELIFETRFEIEEDESGAVFEGDAERGAELSLVHCGRCHVVGPENRMNGLGSTPSFAVLRTLPDWADRFQQFYVLNPHPSFTQVAEVTPPFDPSLPPPIVPVEITLDDLEAILAFVSTTGAADLGAPLQLQ